MIKQPSKFSENEQMIDIPQEWEEFWAGFLEINPMTDEVDPSWIFPVRKKLEEEEKP